MEKLAAEITELNRRRIAMEAGGHEFSVNQAEELFVAAADARGKRLYRSGWPDFLCVDRDTGGVCFVEVKNGEDEVSRSQELMFTALERHFTARVLIWDPRWPMLLTPWRKYQEEREERLAAMPDGARQHQLRYVQRRKRGG